MLGGTVSGEWGGRGRGANRLDGVDGDCSVHLHMHLLGYYPYSSRWYDSRPPLWLMCVCVEEQAHIRYGGHRGEQQARAMARG